MGKHCFTHYTNISGEEALYQIINTSTDKTVNVSAVEAWSIDEPAYWTIRQHNDPVGAEDSPCNIVFGPQGPYPDYTKVYQGTYVGSGNVPGSRHSESFGLAGVRADFHDFGNPIVTLPPGFGMVVCQHVLGASSSKSFCNIHFEEV